MKEDEILQQELDALSDDAVAAADKLCEVFRAFDKIDAGKPTEEEAKKYHEFLFEVDRRRALILRRILIEFGGFLYL